MEKTKIIETIGCVDVEYGVAIPTPGRAGKKSKYPHILDDFIESGNETAAYSFADKKGTFAMATAVRRIILDRRSDIKVFVRDNTVYFFNPNITRNGGAEA